MTGDGSTRRRCETSDRQAAADRLFDAAVAYHRQDRLSEAEALYRDILAGDPEHPGALHNLALLRQRQGRLDDAAALLRRVIALDPGMAGAHNNLGTVLRAQQRDDEAIGHFDRALALDPGLAVAHDNLAQLHLARGRHAEAIAQFEKLLALAPDHADARFNLGKALYAADRPAEAVAQYEAALALRPGDAEALNNLGTALQALDRHDEAMIRFEQALALRPDLAMARNNLGNTLVALGRHDAAIQQYEAALALRPDHADAASNLGEALKELGRIEAARAAFAQAIALAPRRADFHRRLAQVKTFAAGDAELAAMAALSGDAAALLSEQRCELDFALAKAYADLGEHERSFHHLLAANAARRREIAYDEAATLALFERARAVFTPVLLRDRAGAGDPAATPVFIFGMPRSGTTLVEQILASHPQIFGAGELTLFGALATGEGDEFPEAVSSLSAAAYCELGRRYLSRLPAVAPSALRITDKTPANFLFAGLIHLALPQARLVHVRRDPVDTCVSCFSTLFARGHAYAYDLAELGRYYCAYAGVMAQWRRVMPPGVMLDIDYEDVVADLEESARRLVAHCGLAWDEACLAFHQNRRPVRTASAVQVRRPLYRDAVGRGRLYGPLLAPLRAALNPVLTGLS
jgi:tetratricopeptide (TPR) repeat protein